MSRFESCRLPIDASLFCSNTNLIFCIHKRWHQQQDQHKNHPLKGDPLVEAQKEGPPSRKGERCPVMVAAVQRFNAIRPIADRINGLALTGAPCPYSSLYSSMFLSRKGNSLRSLITLLC